MSRRWFACGRQAVSILLYAAMVSACATDVTPPDYESEIIYRIGGERITAAVSDSAGTIYVVGSQGTYRGNVRGQRLVRIDSTAPRVTNLALLPGDTLIGLSLHTIYRKSLPSGEWTVEKRVEADLLGLHAGSSGGGAYATGRGLVMVRQQGEWMTIADTTQPSNDIAWDVDVRGSAAAVTFGQRFWTIRNADISASPIPLAEGTGRIYGAIALGSDFLALAGRDWRSTYEAPLLAVWRESEWSHYDLSDSQIPSGFYAGNSIGTNEAVFWTYDGGVVHLDSTGALRTAYRPLSIRFVTVVRDQFVVVGNKEGDAIVLIMDAPAELVR